MTQYAKRVGVENSENIYSNVYSGTAHIGFIFTLFTKWKGSVFKLIYHDFLMFIFLYAILSIFYRYVFYTNDYNRQLFEVICFYMNGFSKLIPIAFLTGFYVSSVVSRWWDQFMTLPWPDKLALKLVNFCPGADDFNRNLRRTVMRYVNLSTILVYRLVSPVVMKRFPDYDSLLNAKLMLPHEVKRLKKTDKITPLDKTTWAPMLWAMKLLTKARSEGKVKIEPPIFANLISSFEAIETANRKILNYGWVNFPLAYTQVVTISVYIYFLAALFGRQYLIPNSKDPNFKSYGDVYNVTNSTLDYYLKAPYRDHSPDFQIPFFTVVEFLCYMGWIKVAANLLNPFGDDDEDFKINYLIDRNLQVSYIIVDEADRDIELEKDPFLAAGINIPDELPYQEKTPKLDRKKSEETTLIERTTSLVRKASTRLASNMTPKLNRKMSEPCNQMKVDSSGWARATSVPPIPLALNSVAENTFQTTKNENENIPKLITKTSVDENNSHSKFDEEKSIYSNLENGQMPEMPEFAKVPEMSKMPEMSKTAKIPDMPEMPEIPEISIEPSSPAVTMTYFNLGFETTTE